MPTIKTTIRNRRIDVPAPSDIPDGAEVTVTIDASEIYDNESMSPEEYRSSLGCDAKARTAGDSCGNCVRL